MQRRRGILQRLVTLKGHLVIFSEGGFRAASSVAAACQQSAAGHYWSLLSGAVAVINERCWSVWVVKGCGGALLFVYVCVSHVLKLNIGFILICSSLSFCFTHLSVCELQDFGETGCRCPTHFYCFRLMFFSSETCNFLDSTRREGK